MQIRFILANLMRDFGGKYIVAFDVSSEDDTGTTNFGEHLSGLRVSQFWMNKSWIFMLN